MTKECNHHNPDSDLYCRLELNHDGYHQSWKDSVPGKTYMSFNVSNWDNEDKDLDKSDD